LKTSVVRSLYKLPNTNPASDIGTPIGPM